MLAGDDMIDDETEFRILLWEMAIFAHTLRTRADGRFDAFFHFASGGWRMPVKRSSRFRFEYNEQRFGSKECVKLALFVARKSTVLHLIGEFLEAGLLTRRKLQR